MHSIILILKASPKGSITRERCSSVSHSTTDVSVTFVHVYSARSMFKGAVRSRPQLPLFLLVYCSTPIIDGEPLIYVTSAEFALKTGSEAV